MFCDYAIIKKTGEVDYDGYHTGVITLYDKENNILEQKVIDCFHTDGDIQFDFEGDGHIKLWAFGRNTMLDIDDSYGPKISAIKLY